MAAAIEKQRHDQSIAQIASSEPSSTTAQPTLWQLPAGRLIELSGTHARISSMLPLLLDAQQQNEPIIWIQARYGSLYPPDLATAGVDLNRLTVVHAPHQRHAIPKAAEIALRSGGYGVVILDFSGVSQMPRDLAWQQRLAALSKAHQAWTLLLTHTAHTAPSCGPLVSLRLESRYHTPPALHGIPQDARYVLMSTDILKNKLGLSLQHPLALRRGPCGLR